MAYRLWILSSFFMTLSLVGMQDTDVEKLHEELAEKKTLLARCFAIIEKTRKKEQAQGTLKSRLEEMAKENATLLAELKNRKDECANLRAIVAESYPLYEYLRDTIAPQYEALKLQHESLQSEFDAVKRENALYAKIDSVQLDSLLMQMQESANSKLSVHTKLWVQERQDLLRKATLSELGLKQKITQKDALVKALFTQIVEKNKKLRELNQQLAQTDKAVRVSTARVLQLSGELMHIKKGTTNPVDHSELSQGHPLTEKN